jgi:hypothetical protein
VTSTVDMVSSSCQTISDLPSPPWTPIAATQSILGDVEASMISISTQTEKVVIIAPEPQNEPQQYHLPIPKIAIHPPGSESPSPKKQCGSSSPYQEHFLLNRFHIAGGGQIGGHAN